VLNLAYQGFNYTALYPNPINKFYSNIRNLILSYLKGLEIAELKEMDITFVFEAGELTFN
jgi:hypothetical protein